MTETNRVRVLVDSMESRDAGALIVRIDPTTVTHRMRAEAAMRELRAHLTPDLLDVIERAHDTFADVIKATLGSSDRDDGSLASLTLWNKIDGARADAREALAILTRLSVPR